MPDEGRLPSPIRAHQAVHHPRRKRERDAIERKAALRLADKLRGAEGVRQLHWLVGRRFVETKKCSAMRRANGSTGATPSSRAFTFARMAIVSFWSGKW